MNLFRILLLTFSTYALISCGGAEERKAVYLEKAIASIEAGDNDKARIELKNVLQIDPKDGTAHYYLGKVFEKQKKYRKAYGEYLKAEELSPELLENHAKLGSFYLLLLNDPEKAQEKVDLILSKEPKNSSGLLLTAAIEVKNEGNDKAIKIVEGVISRDPEHVESVIFLAIMHITAERYSKAIDVLDAALKDNKDNEELTKLLATALMSNKSYDRAELIYKDFLERNPDSSSSYNNLATFYNVTDNAAKAEEIFRASFNNKPDDVDRQTLLIKFIRAKKGTDEAIKELDKLITDNSGLGNLRTALGELYILKGDEQAAIETYQKAVEDFSEDATGISARTALASIYISNKDYDKAEAVIEDALAISHNDPDVNFLNAEFAIINKDFEKATIALRIVTKETPENIEAFILLAKIYQSEGSDEQVKSTLNSAYNNNRSTASALLVLAKYHLSTDIKLAEKIIDDYNSLRDDDYEGLSLKAGILNQNKMQDKAFVIAEKLMEMFPDKPNGYLQTVPFYGLSTDTEKAIAVLEKGYMNVKDNRNILLVLTSVQASLKQYDTAANRISVELKKSPDDDELKLILAKVYLKDEKVGLATTLLTEIVDGNSILEEPYLLLSAIHKNKNDFDIVKSVLVKGKVNVTSSIRIPLSLASFHEFEGEYKKAIDVYHDLNDSHPDNLIIINNYASMLSDYGNGEDDLVIAKKLALKLELSSQPAFLDTVGWVYHKLNDSEKAVQYLTQAVEKSPKINVFNYHLGMAYKAKGDMVNAKVYLDKSLADGKDFKEKEMAKKALGNL